MPLSMMTKLSGPLPQTNGGPPSLFRSSEYGKLRDPSQMVPLPTALQVRNGGGGGFSGWVAGCAAVPVGTRASATSTAHTVAGVIRFVMMALLLSESRDRDFSSVRA